MKIFGAMDIAASGMTAERLRMDVIANNIANANTTRTQEGGPYRRQMPVFEQRNSDFHDLLNQEMASGNGVRVTGIEKDGTPPRRVYDPTHPDADSTGYVQMPNISIVTEMVDMISATRAYEANVTAVNAAKNMAMKALDIGKA